MDITLERILSLLPRTDDGKFVRGSKKEFAKKLGYDNGDIVSMWIKGTSSSYKGKLYEISAVYNVSVEWLKGETDKKEKLPIGIDRQLTDEERELIRLFDIASPERRLSVMVLLREHEFWNNTQGDEVKEK